MPPAFNFATFNPTFNWVKERIYDTWVQGKLIKPYYFLEAFPSDNPFVTEDQWLAWQQMDEQSQARFIRGLWDFNIKGQFMYAFDERQHTTTGLNYKPHLPLWISFDFNVDPMTAIVAQTDFNNWLHVIKEYRQPNSDTYALCTAIKEDYAHLNPLYQITGDATGQNRMAGTRGQINHYQIIRNELGIGWRQFHLPKANPGISDSRVFCNSILSKFPEVLIDAERCPWLIKDCKFVLTGTDGEGRLSIKKTGQNEFANMDNAKLGHLMDDLRYLFHASLTNFVTIPRS